MNALSLPNHGISGLSAYAFRPLRRGVEQIACSPDKTPHCASGGTLGGTIPPTADRYARFTELMTENGITAAQMIYIEKAMQEAGLAFTNQPLQRD